MAHEGRWSYDFSTHQVQLEDSLLVTDGFGKLTLGFDAPTTHGLRGLLVQNGRRGTRLAVVEDLGFYLERQ